MNQYTQNSAVELGRDGIGTRGGFGPDHALDLPLAPQQKTAWPNADPAKSLEKNTAALAAAYLDVNLNLRSVPLKEFMDDLEKNILLSCLRLTHGNQRNAAALLGIKPTALFEKMRKHGINGRQIKLSEKLVGARYQGIA
ncbi:MAG TPA: helix-turn-helix domain-containing protein [Candidatus Binatia bacterium]|nr:helix-turn-helix domain-containing protein [Candidatus Binatia bacterium]